jgi:predicted membrane protein
MNGYEHRYRRRCRRSSAAGGFVFALLITAVGVVMLLNTLGWVDATNFWDYVPLVLVTVGVVKVVESRGNAVSMAFGGILAVAGSLWFLDNTDILMLNKRFLLPFVIISIGVVLLIRAVERQQVGDAFRGAAAPEGYVNVWTMFGGVKRFVDSPEFRGADAFAMFGGVELDLSTAQIAEHALIDANAIFGGIEIKVPQDWNVEMKGLAIFGGYEDKTFHPRLEQNPPRLVLTGFAVFGGVTIKN